MAGAGESVLKDDIVLPAARALSAFIVPFLVVAFVVLYGFPRRTEQLFAWTIAPPMTPMTLGAVYIGGAYFFVRAFRTTAWHTVKSGFVAVGTFASLMGVATIVHWDRFNHTHVAFRPSSPPPGRTTISIGCGSPGGTTRRRE